MNHSASGQQTHSAPRCRVRDVLDRVGHRWSVYVITLLGNGPCRFGDLKRDIESVTQRMLTVTLRGLERDGLITRTVYPEVPPRVEYALTSMGESFLEALQVLLTWSVDHVEQIDAAKERYDRSKAERT